MKRVLLAGLAAVMTVVAWSSASAAKSLPEYKAIYEAELSKINADDSGKKAADAAYVRDLEHVSEVAVQKADVQTARAAAAEKTRFEESRELIDVPPGTLSKPIVEAQTKHRTRLLAIQATRDKRIVKMASGYVKALKGLARTLLKAQEFDKATEVDGEIKRVDFVIADLSTRLRKMDGDKPAQPGTRSAPAKKPEPPRSLTKWTVIFRSDDPSVWLTDGENSVPLRKISNRLKYVRLKRCDTDEYVILAVRKAEMDVAGGTDARYVWSGSRVPYGDSRALGIADNLTNAKRPRHQIAVMRDKCGWGFGHKTFAQIAQYYSWDRQEIPRTVFEIAVSHSPLTAEEEKALLVQERIGR